MYNDKFARGGMGHCSRTPQRLGKMTPLCVLVVTLGTASSSGSEGSGSDIPYLPPYDYQSNQSCLAQASSFKAPFTYLTVIECRCEHVSLGITMPTANTDMQTGGIVTDRYLCSVLDASTHTREQCMNLIELAEASAISASQVQSVEVQIELSNQQKLLNSYISQLRELNRNAITKVRNTKQITAEARQEIDRLHLQLQNLYYEERHLRGEIAACESYE